MNATLTGARTVIHPVTDLAAAKAVYTTLFGTAPAVDEPYYVGWSVAGQDVGLDPHGHAQGLTGPVTYWHVDDLAATARALIENGAREVTAAREVGPGRTIVVLADPDGNPIGLLQDA